MGLLSNLFGNKNPSIRSYADFWNWFAKHQEDFHDVVKYEDNVVKNFFAKLQPALQQINEGINYVTGMCDKNTVELVLTGDGVLKYIIIVEELVAAAPAIEGWKFTALKPEQDINDLKIIMDGYSYHKDNISFYANYSESYPDEIDLTIVHDDMTDDNKNDIINGLYIFFDNYLGELNFAVIIDNLEFKRKEEAEKELIPIGKLKAYIAWREKEFVEKYEGSRYNTEKDKYAVMETNAESGKGLVAVVNTDLMNWDRKASHPWLLTVEIPYDGTQNNGMPDKATCQWLDEIENEFKAVLKDHEGYLNIARQTFDNKRTFYFGCKDFRKPSKLAREIQQRYAGKANFSYDIYKDKYWIRLNKFLKKV